MVYVQGRHVYVLLVAACPAPWGLEVHLGNRTAGDVVVEVGHQVEIAVEVDECSRHVLLYLSV